MTEAALKPLVPKHGRAASARAWPRLGLRPGTFAGLLALLAGAFMLNVAVGSVNIPLPDTVAVLLGSQPTNPAYTTIIQVFRLPKALTAILAGTALAVGGLQMQTLFRNPLADPFVLGINAGASLGVSLVVLAAGVTGSTLLAGLSLLGDFGLAFAASLGAGLVLLLVLLVARRVRSSITLLILGLMFGYGVGAVVSLLLHFSLAERIRVYINWTFGNFGGVTWSQMQVFAPVVLLGLLIAFSLAKPLNALLLGETYARSMGLNVKRARLWIVTSTALLAGAVTAFCGPIAFLGIAVPHLCRILFKTADHRVLVPAASVVGAMIALVADMVAQVPGSQVILPLNAVLAFIGAPFVIWIILRQRSLRTAFE